MCRRPKNGRLKTGLRRFWTLGPVRRPYGRDLTGRLLTGRVPYGVFLRNFEFLRDLLGPFTEKDDEEAYGKAKGRLLTGGTLAGKLTGRVPYEGFLLRPFSEKDNEKVNGKAGLLREDPLRGGFFWGT